MNKLPPFSALWKETWNRFSANNNLMLSIGALGSAPLIAITFIPIGDSITRLLVVVVLFLLAALWSALASMAIYASAAHPEIRTVGDAFRLGAARWIPFLTTQILEGLAVFLPFLVLMGILVAISVPAIHQVGFEHLDKLNPSSIAIIASVLIAGAIALSFWAYRLTFSGFIVFSEGKKNLAALRSSFAMTKGRIMELWAKFFIFGLCIVAISIGVNIVAGIATSGLNENSSAYLIINTLFSFLNNVVLIPLETLFVAVLYHEIRQAQTTPPVIS